MIRIRGAGSGRSMIRVPPTAPLPLNSQSTTSGRHLTPDMQARMGYAFCPPKPIPQLTGSSGFIEVALLEASRQQVEQTAAHRDDSPAANAAWSAAVEAWHKSFDSMYPG